MKCDPLKENWLFSTNLMDYKIGQIFNGHGVTLARALEIIDSCRSEHYDWLVKYVSPHTDKIICSITIKEAKRLLKLNQL
jgi:hypothetical protein